MQQQRQNLKVKSKGYVVFLAIVISAGSFVVGYSLVATALLQVYIQQQNTIPQTQIDYYLSIIIALLPLGAILGSLLSEKMVKLIGEKKVLVYIDFLMIVALFIEAASLKLQYMYISRLIFGFFCGVSSSVTPIYLTSIAPLNMTGLIGSLNQLMITLGIAAAYAANIFLESDILQKKLQIVYFIILPFAFCLMRISIFLLIFPYDTAERHYENKEFQKVKQIMLQIYLNPNYEQFCKTKNLSSQNSPEKQKYKIQTISKECTVLTAQGKKRILNLAIVIAISNQVCGINTIFFYAKQLFTSLTDNDKNMVQNYLLGLGFFQVFVTLINSFLLDKFGRRSLMLTGLTIVVISLFSVFIATDILELPSSMVVFFVFLHILGFSISLGPVCCLYASQIMRDISLVLILIWSQTLVIAMVSDFMISSLGIGKTFFIFGMASLGCLIYFQKQMIQSKGLNRVELQRKFNQTSLRLEATGDLPEIQEINKSQN